MRILREGKGGGTIIDWPSKRTRIWKNKYREQEVGMGGGDKVDKSDYNHCLLLGFLFLREDNFQRKKERKKRLLFDFGRSWIDKIYICLLVVVIKRRKRIKESRMSRKRRFEEGKGRGAWRKKYSRGRETIMRDHVRCDDAWTQLSPRGVKVDY